MLDFDKEKRQEFHKFSTDIINMRDEWEKNPKNLSLLQSTKRKYDEFMINNDEKIIMSHFDKYLKSDLSEVVLFKINRYKQNVLKEISDVKLTFGNYINKQIAELKETLKQEEHIPPNSCS